MAITPNGKTLYAIDPIHNAITPVSTATSKIGSPIPVGNEPGSLVFAR